MSIPLFVTASGNYPYYIGAVALRAERKDLHGVPGYRVLNEDDEWGWIPAERFERHFREFGHNYCGTMMACKKSAEGVENAIKETKVKYRPGVTP